MPGLIDQFASRRLFDILDESWIVVSTATREGLPNAFLEAAAHRGAILSNVASDRGAESHQCGATPTRSETPRDGSSCGSTLWRRMTSSNTAA
ncbi:MAG: glycosyltransferase family 4 protein [Alphaproteobacteria bacterium]|nr:glycosyltransferase family 4 protein [Alphaproteobacteria bacterium]